MKTCPKCNKSFPDKGKFCPFDGTPLVSTSDDQGVSDKPPSPAQATTNPQDIKPHHQETPDTVKTTSEKVTGQKPKKAKRFRETKWFMMGDQMKDEDIEIEDLPMEELQKKYMVTSELPPEIRKKYSLEYKEEGDKKK